MSIRPLTRRQREVYDFVRGNLTAKGYAPSLAEICGQFGLSSLATAHKHLVNLQHKGYIRRAWNRSRSIELLMTDGRCPHCSQLMPGVTVTADGRT